MFIFISRFSRRRKPIRLLTTPHFYSTATATATTKSSKLYTEYSFQPPPSLKHHQNPNPAPAQPARKLSKPRYRPPSSLDPVALEPVKSDLPFDFRFSYTESSAKVRPIGLREPKYSPFGPGRLDRSWTGVCAPAVDPKVGSVETEKELEEKRRVLRERIQGEPLSNAERKALVERCQRHRTKRQINLGNHRSCLMIHSAVFCFNEILFIFVGDWNFQFDQGLFFGDWS